MPNQLKKKPDPEIVTKPILNQLKTKPKRKTMEIHRTVQIVRQEDERGEKETEDV